MIQQEKAIHLIHQVFLQVFLAAALDKGDEHLRARHGHLKPQARLQRLSEPILSRPPQPRSANSRREFSQSRARRIDLRSRVQ